MSYGEEFDTLTKQLLGYRWSLTQHGSQHERKHNRKRYEELLAEYDRMAAERGLPAFYS